MLVISEKLRSGENPHSSAGYEEHGLFLFPNTNAGWLATVGFLGCSTHSPGGSGISLVQDDRVLRHNSQQ